MSDLERELRERLHRVDTLGAPSNLRSTLDRVVETPPDRRNRGDRRDRRRPLRLLAIAAIVATGSVAILATGRERPDTVFVPSVDPSTKASATAPLSSVPPQPTGEARWTRVAAFPSSGGLPDIAAIREGYVVTDGSRTIQFSPDGGVWTPIQLPLGEGIIVAAGPIGSDRDSVQVVGGYSPCTNWDWDDLVPAQCHMRPTAWNSDDGRSWTGGAEWSGAVAPEGWFGSLFSDTWPVPDAGWDAQQIFYRGAEADPVGPALHHAELSAPGQWSLLRAVSIEPDGAVPTCESYSPSGSFWAVAFGSQRIAPRLCDGLGSLSVSRDGRPFQPVESFPFGQVSDGLAPVGSSPFVFVGSRGEGGTPTRATAWSSLDLAVWMSVDLPVPGGIARSRVLVVSSSGPGFVAVGGAGPAAEEDRQLTWLSDDGTTWRLADVAIGSPYVIEATEGPGGVIAVGYEEGPTGLSTVIWRLDAGS
jgi:hypothetical protein